MNLSENTQIASEDNTSKKVLLILSAVRTVACVGIFAVILFFALDILSKFNALYTQLEAAAVNITTLSAQIENADLPGLVSDVNDLVENADTLVTESTENLDSVVKKIDNVDFEKLNQAIDDLASVIEPIAQLFGN